MSKKDLDNLFRDSFEDHKEEVGLPEWNAFQSYLDKEENNKTLIWLDNVKLITALSVFILLVLGMLNIWDAQPNLNKKVEEVELALDLGEGKVINKNNVESNSESNSKTDSRDNSGKVILNNNDKAIVIMGSNDNTSQNNKLYNIREDLLMQNASQIQNVPIENNSRTNSNSDSTQQKHQNSPGEKLISEEIVEQKDFTKNNETADPIIYRINDTQNSSLFDETNGVDKLEFFASPNLEISFNLLEVENSSVLPKLPNTFHDIKRLETKKTKNLSFDINASSEIYPYGGSETSKFLSYGLGLGISKTLSNDFSLRTQLAYVFRTGNYNYSEQENHLNYTYNKEQKNYGIIPKALNLATVSVNLKYNQKRASFFGGMELEYLVSAVGRLYSNNDTQGIQSSRKLLTTEPESSIGVIDKNGFTNLQLSTLLGYELPISNHWSVALQMNYILRPIAQRNELEENILIENKAFTGELNLRYNF